MLPNFQRIYHYINKISRITINLFFQTFSDHAHLKASKISMPSSTISNLYFILYEYHNIITIIRSAILACNVNNVLIPTIDVKCISLQKY